MADYLLARTSINGTDTYGSLQLDVFREQSHSRRAGPNADGPASAASVASSDVPEGVVDQDMVMSNVPAEDETLSVNTPRMWTLAIFFSLVGSSANLVFSLRFPSITMTPLIALLLAHPLGVAWDRIFPSSHGYTRINPRQDLLESRLAIMGSRYSSLRQWLGQGRWNRKEHALVYIAANVSFTFAFSTDVLVEQEMFYGQSLGLLYQVLLTLSTQVIGYAFAGMTRKWLVYPASMVWPGTLMSSSLFQAIHVNENPKANGWTISRYRFFIIVFTAGFGWYFIPGFLAPALSYFSVITWLNPSSPTLTSFFGVRHGLGLFPLTFDWSQIAFLGSPLMTPWWAEANMAAGFLIFIGFLGSMLYFANVWYAAYLPILSINMYDNTGSVYNVTRVLSGDYIFDAEKYKAYSPIYFPITYAISYGLQFAALTSLLSYTFLHNRREIARQWRQAGNEKNDELVQEMKKYKEAPIWWYLTTFGVTFLLSIFLVEHYPVHLPWYGLLMALGVALVFYVPIGRIMAITNQMPSLYLVCQMLCGTVFPGRPIANMIFVTFGYISSTQGLKFSSDMKLGHYMKLPPRTLFWVQLLATIVGALAQIGVLRAMLATVRGICTMDAVNGFICPFAKVHFNGSILWGVLGPRRIFVNGIYQPLLWCFLIGFLIPIPVYMLSKRRIFKDVNIPVMLGGVAWIPPATGLNFLSWAAVGFIFNRVIRVQATDWWQKYAMILSAALDSSMAIGMLVVFVSVTWSGISLDWWGTNVYKQGCDWTGCALKSLAAGETFGPKP